MNDGKGFADLEIKYCPAGKNGLATLTARVGDDILAHEKVDLSKPERRRGFADSIVKLRPAFQPEAIEQELLLIAAQLSERRETEPEGEDAFVKIVADTILENNHFALDVSGKLFRYRDGAYRPKAEAYIRAEVKRICVGMNATDQWSTRFAMEVVEWIGVDAPHLWERPPSDVVNVENGLLRLADRILLPHSPSHLSSIQLPVNFDPSATCPYIDTFVSQVFPADAIMLAYEVPAWLMVPDTSIQKAILLLGAGGNGKSTYLAMVLSFLGKTNCVGLSLHKIESSRFAISRLVAKLANICPDLPTEDLSGTSMFKALTGGDFNVEGEAKFKDGFSFDPHCRLVFSANSPPRSADASEAFFDRWLVVPFDARFRGTKEEISRQELDAKLSSPSELSGLLNKVIAAWQGMQQRGGRFMEPESVRKAWMEFHATTDPLAVWLDQSTFDDPAAQVPRQALRAAYIAACVRAGRPALTDTGFGLAIIKARPHVVAANRTINGRRQWVYLGIGIRDRNSFGDQTVQGVQGSNISYHAGAKKEEPEREVLQDIQVGKNPEHSEQSELELAHRSCPICDHSEFVETPIHGGKSSRRDCARCHHTVGFTKWENAPRDV